MKLSDRQTVTLWCTLGAIVLLLIGGWWFATHKRVPQEISIPRTGEARFNPLYALKVALEKDDVRVNARRRLQLFAGSKEEPAVRLGARDTVVIYTDPRTLTTREVDGLLEWVENGGHLVVRTPPSDVLLGAHDSVPLLEDLELSPLGEDSSDCEIFKADPRINADPPADPAKAAGDDEVEVDAEAFDGAMFCSGPRFTLDGANPDYSWGDLQDGYVFARLAWGEGSVDVLADMAFMSSDGLDDDGAQAFTRQVLAPNYRSGTVHLVYATELPSLWLVIIRHSWMAWAPLLLAFLAWLWLRMQRFGPQWPAPDEERRSLLEHIVASGEHLYRYGYAHLLYGAVREAFLSRLRRRDPQAAALTGEPQLALLQARFPDMPGNQIRDALIPPFANDHTSFRIRIATLIRLRNRL
jgi:hypothetical protein